MDRDLIRKFVSKQGMCSVFPEGDLVSPISSLMLRSTQEIVTGTRWSHSFGSDTWTISNNMIHDYLEDFLGEKPNAKSMIYNHRTGEFIKDATRCHEKNNKHSLDVRLGGRVTNSIFRDVDSKDFVYAENINDEPLSSSKIVVAPAEFFSKSIRKSESKKDLAFAFIRYSTGIRNPGDTEGNSLENTIHYSKIKYAERNHEPFIYVENRALSFIKKRHFINLTVNNDYYNSLLMSMAYSYPSDYQSISPAKHLFDKIYNRKLWIRGGSEGLNSISSYVRNPGLLDSIVDVEDDEYLIFDDLDFSYNKDMDLSQSFVITSDGTYTASRKKDGKLYLYSPKKGMCDLNTGANIVNSLVYATAPRPGNIHKHQVADYWMRSYERENPIRYLFGTLSGKHSVSPESAMRTENSSIFPVVRKMWNISSEGKVAKKDEKIEFKNSKTAPLLERLSEEHDNIYKDFKNKSYKVTLKKLRKVFDLIPRVLVGTKLDHKNGDAISLGQNMYIKLVDYLPDRNILDNRRAYLKGGIVRVEKIRDTETRIRATMGWLLFAWSGLEGISTDKPPTHPVNRRIIDIYTGSANYSPERIAYNDWSQPPCSFKINYSTKKGKYIQGPDSFNSFKPSSDRLSPDFLSALANARQSECEPLFEPTQYKAIVKDDEGNIAYSIVRPFLGIEYNPKAKVPRISLLPSIPMNSLAYVITNETCPSVSVSLYRNDTKELVTHEHVFHGVLPENSDGFSWNIKESELRHSPKLLLQNKFASTLEDILTGSLSTEKSPYIDSRELALVPAASLAWSSVFSECPSKFFDEYDTPDIIYGAVGEKSQKLKSGNSIKNYFKGTSFEILRIDAWLALRPADKTNLNLYNPKHWVNQRKLLDREFITYMFMVLLEGAYQLTTIVEAGMDTRELSYDDYSDRLDDIYPHHLRGPYGISVLEKDLYMYRSSPYSLSYASGCFSSSHLKLAPSYRENSTKRFCDINLGIDDGIPLVEETLRALLKIRNGEISTYADFVLESFSPLVKHHTKKERKAVRSRLIKFFLSENYSTSVLLTCSQAIIEQIVACGGVRSDSDIVVPTVGLEEGIREIESIKDFGTKGLSASLRDVLSMPICRVYGYSLFEVFKYLESVVLEQRAEKDVPAVIPMYRDYIEDLHKSREYIEYDLLNRKTAFPDSLKLQADIAKHNREIAEDKRETERFQQGSAKYKIMEYQNARYTIRMARTPLELVVEGDSLGHCVGGYSQSMANGSKIIFFLRSRSKKDKSNITVEFIPYTGSLTNVSVASTYTSAQIEQGNLEFVMKGYINQVQGSSRRPVNRDEALFLNEWKKFVEDQMRKKIDIVPSIKKNKKVKIRHEFIFGNSIQKQIRDQL